MQLPSLVFCATTGKKANVIVISPKVPSFTFSINYRRIKGNKFLRIYAFSTILQGLGTEPWKLVWNLITLPPNLEGHDAFQYLNYQIWSRIWRKLPDYSTPYSKCMDFEATTKPIAFLLLLPNLLFFQLQGWGSAHIHAYTSADGESLLLSCCCCPLCYFLQLQGQCSTHRHLF